VANSSSIATPATAAVVTCLRQQPPFSWPICSTAAYVHHRPINRNAITFLPLATRAAAAAVTTSTTAAHPWRPKRPVYSFIASSATLAARGATI